MQAYALAVGELMPSLVNDGSSIISTLHFLDPNVESHLDPELLRADACARAIDEAMMQIVSSREPSEFPVMSGNCIAASVTFLAICPPGREWLRESSTTDRHGSRPN